MPQIGSRIESRNCINVLTTDIQIGAKYGKSVFQLQKQD